MLIDTHCHLDSETFAAELPELLERAREAQVVHLLTIGINLATSRAAVRIAERFPSVSAVVGIQPNYAAEADPDDFGQIVDLCRHPQVVGIGETGLDRYWDFAPLELQEQFFRQHIELSRETGLPFVVHCRDAEEDTVRVLADAARAGSGVLSGVMHSFCGDAAVAEQCLELGLHISFAGMVTFRKNDALRDVARRIPEDRLLVETDAPYLAPQPRRGKRNEPAFVRMTAECLAEVRGVSLKELAAATTRNACRLFGLELRESGNGTD